MVARLGFLRYSVVSKYPVHFGYSRQIELIQTFPLQLLYYALLISKHGKSAIIPTVGRNKAEEKRMSGGTTPE